MRTLVVLLLSIATGVAHHPSQACMPPEAVQGGKYCEVPVPGCTDASCAFGGLWVVGKDDNGVFTVSCLLSNQFGAPLPPVGYGSFTPNPVDPAELWVTVTPGGYFAVANCGEGLLKKADCETQGMGTEAMAVAPERFVMDSSDTVTHANERLVAPCPRPNLGSGPYTVEEYDAWVTPLIAPRPPPFPPPMPPLPACACDIYSNGASMGMEYMCLSRGKYAPMDKAVCTPTRPGFPGKDQNGGHYDYFCDQAKTLCMGGRPGHAH